MNRERSYRQLEKLKLKYPKFFHEDHSPFHDEHMPIPNMTYPEDHEALKEEKLVETEEKQYRPKKQKTKQNDYFGQPLKKNLF